MKTQQKDIPMEPSKTQEPSHIAAAHELMEFYDFEKEAEKNLQNRYTAPPQEVIDQIRADSCRPQK
jgi:hypothetical protein